MQTISRFFRKLRLLFQRDEFAADLSEEMEFHREQRSKELERDGMAPERAAEAARREFGNSTKMQERGHDAVAFGFENVAQDFRFALRQFRKNPGFAITAIAILALGMGASIAIFGFIDAALIKPLPYPNPSRVVAVYESLELIPRSNLSYPDFVDWKKSSDVFSSFDAYGGRDFLLADHDGVRSVTGIRVSDGFFRTLGVMPVIGRDFSPGEDLLSAPRTVILSYAGWQKYFGGSREALGKTVTLSDTAYTVVGVLPRDFQFAPAGTIDFWVTLHPEGSCDLRRSCHGMYGVARLEDGVTIASAESEMRSIAARLEKEYPDSNRGQSAAVVSLSDATTGDIRPILLVLLGGSELLLLIACVNVTSLLMARSEGRRREMAVRGALGASFARLARQFATEGLVLVVAGGALSVFAGFWAMQSLTKLIPAYMRDGMPFLQSVGFNWHVASYTAVIAVLAAALFTAVPLLRLSLDQTREDLADGGRGGSTTAWRRFGSNLVVVELAVAVVLLVGAGLLGKSLYRLLNVPLGMNPNHLATLQISAPNAAYGKDPQAIALSQRILAAISALPGVESVGITGVLPVSGNGNTDWIRFVGRPYDGKHIEVNEREVSVNYFSALQTKLIRGRFFSEADDLAHPKVIMINQTLAKRYFPNEDPIGKKVGDTELKPESLREIVGVVDDLKEGSLDSQIWPAEYFPYNQNTDTSYAIVARTSQDEASLLPVVSKVIREIDPNIAVENVATMNTFINHSPTAYLHRSAAWLLGAFSILALVLGAVGLYGVISYSVGQRSREIGVRMALGAQRSSVYRLVLGEAGWLTVMGIGVGIVVAVSLAMLMRGMLFGVASWDFSTLAGVALLLACCSLFAAYVPARRAASLDPVEVLRSE